MLIQIYRGDGEKINFLDHYFTLADVLNMIFLATFKIKYAGMKYPDNTYLNYLPSHFLR